MKVLFAESHNLDRPDPVGSHHYIRLFREAGHECFWLGPAVSTIGLGASVLISSKAKTFMQAQQMSGLLVLPIVFLMIGQTVGLFFLSAWLTVIAGLFAWIIGLWLVWVGARTFARGELVARV